MHALNVGPTPKPCLCIFNITLFNKKDFPVLYFPTKLIIPILFGAKCINSSLASVGIINLLFSYTTNGKAFSFGGV